MLKLLRAFDVVDENGGIVAVREVQAFRIDHEGNEVENSNPTIWGPGNSHLIPTDVPGEYREVRSGSLLRERPAGP